jgi:hypothetical protein
VDVDDLGLGEDRALLQLAQLVSSDRGLPSAHLCAVLCGGRASNQMHMFRMSQTHKTSRKNRIVEKAGLAEATSACLARGGGTPRGAAAAQALAVAGGHSITGRYGAVVFHALERDRIE